jgi:hypothetical protein
VSGSVCSSLTDHGTVANSKKARATVGILDSIRSWFMRSEQLPPAEVEMASLPVSTNGVAEAPDIDFSKILASAGIDASQQSRVSKTKHLLGSLPTEASGAIQRQIIEAALGTFDISVHAILQSASAEVEALRGYVDLNETETQRKLVASAQSIADLEAEILDERESMAKATADQLRRKELAEVEMKSVQTVLRFFVREAISAVVVDNRILNVPGDASPLAPPPVL